MLSYSPVIVASWISWSSSLSSPCEWCCPWGEATTVYWDQWFGPSPCGNRESRRLELWIVVCLSSIIIIVVIFGTNIVPWLRITRLYWIDQIEPSGNSRNLNCVVLTIAHFVMFRLFVVANTPNKNNCENSCSSEFFIFLSNIGIFWFLIHIVVSGQYVLF